MDTSFFCPACGMRITEPGSNCPLCRANLYPVTRRGAARLALWGLVSVEYLVALIVWARH